MSDTALESTDQNASIITAYKDIPYSILDDDVPKAVSSDFFKNLGTIKEYYEIYKKGSKFNCEGANGDYVPSQLKFKVAKTLIDKEARFMFANTPDIHVNLNDIDSSEEAKKQNTILNDYVDEVLKKNSFSSKLVKAAKDCFIGGRVCLVMNFDDKGIEVTFINALEFYYEQSGKELTKLIIFYQTNAAISRRAQRIKKKKFEMENGRCYVEENMYDGSGKLVEEIMPRTAIELDFIPAYIILNDGLSDDVDGESEIAEVDDYESHFSKLSNADIDSERKSMNSIKYTIDASSNSTENLSTAPGAFWDIQSDDNAPVDRTAKVGSIEPSIGYSEALKTTLERIMNMMHAQLSIPNIDSEKLQGVITSGKALKALYWPLTVRCDEKSLVWTPAIEFVVRTIIEGSIVYPMVLKQYTMETRLPNIFYTVTVENNYPLPEDTEEEKALDIMEVNAQLMSRKAYMKKWRRLTDKEADAELEQIMLEKQLLEDSMMDMDTFGNTASEGLE